AVHDDRWLAMFVYAKPWWIDSVNYEGGDYGGFKVPDPRPVENPGKLPMYLIEVQTGAYLGEDDIVRYEDIYDRV
ncbi:MAG: hypothetical protein AAF360_15185, partial [Pseudomonadota bacterium]